MALAAVSMLTMLLPRVRPGTGGTPALTSTDEVCMPPLAAILAEGDTRVVRSGPDEACPAKDVDGLVVQGLPVWESQMLKYT